MAKKTDDLKITDEELKLIQEQVQVINNLQMQIGGLEMQKQIAVLTVQKSQTQLQELQNTLDILGYFSRFLLNDSLYCIE